MRLDVSVRQLQLCLWDDERQRLLPAAGGGETETHGGSLLGDELFCLSVDRLHLHLSRQLRLEVPGGGGGTPLHPPALHPWQRQPLLVSTAWLAAGGVQLDSYLPGSEQPVLLTSLPEDSFEGMADTSSSSRRPGPPLQLGLVMHHCPAVTSSCSSAADPTAEGGSGGGMSFRNAWVHDLLVQLPTLAVAADDALLLFADRASALLLSSGGDEDAGSSSDGLGGSGKGSSPSAGLGGSGKGSSPSAGGGQEASANAAQQAQLVAGSSQLEPAEPLALLQQSLAAEAAGAAASRLYIEQAAVESGEMGCVMNMQTMWSGSSLVRDCLLDAAANRGALPSAPLLTRLCPACSAAAAGCTHHSGHSGRACGSGHAPRPRHPVAHCSTRRAVQVRSAVVDVALEGCLSVRRRVLAGAVLQAALTLASKLCAAHNRPALHRPRTASCRPHILVRGLMAHGVAEALLNAPQVRWVG